MVASKGSDGRASSAMLELSSERLKKAAREYAEVLEESSRGVTCIVVTVSDLRARKEAALSQLMRAARAFAIDSYQAEADEDERQREEQQRIAKSKILAEFDASGLGGGTRLLS